MVRLLAGGVALIACVGAANAADLPRPKYPVKAPPVAAPAWDWSGFYLGAFYGNSLSQSQATTPDLRTGGSEPGAVDINNGGWLGGVSGGYNWQFAPSWLVGVEGDIGYFGGKRLSQEWSDNIADGEKNSWFATARARVGYVTGPALIYVTGGGAWVHVTDTFGGFSTFAPPTASSATVGGAAIGGGIEVKLSRNWSTKTEYIYIDGGNRSFASNPFGSAGTPTNFNHSFQIIKTGLNYRFDGAWDPLSLFGGDLQPTNHNWNGFYAGGNAGIGSSMVQISGLNPPAGNNDLNGTGFSGGGQIGYNYMLWQKYLLGVEGDFNYLGIHHTVTDWDDTFDQMSTETTWYSTLRGRVGTTTGPALLYLTGGVAFVHVTDGFLPSTAPGARGPGDISSKTLTGWTFGGGTEVALDAHWSARLESFYIDAGSRNHSDMIPFPFFLGKFDERFTIVRAGLNYQFN